VLKNPAFEVSRVGGVVVLTMNVEAAERLVDFMQDQLNDGIQVDPSVYAMGERVSKKIDPDLYFGVRRSA
jgi:hypothetical protein